MGFFTHNNKQASSAEPVLVKGQPASKEQLRSLLHKDIHIPDLDGKYRDGEIYGTLDAVIDCGDIIISWCRLEWCMQSGYIPVSRLLTVIDGKTGLAMMDVNAIKKPPETVDGER